jgi:muconate cycloisomerase
MPRLSRFELMSVDLPFRRAFRHAAADRSRSESLFLKCVTDDGAVGFGECLPRSYVTGETRETAMVLLQESILPRLIGMEFASMEDVHQFLAHCDGQAPSGWIDSLIPHSAAWCAVDLALLDALGRSFGAAVTLPESDDRNAVAAREPFRYSAVVSADAGWRYAVSLLKVRLFGFKHTKLKVGERGVLAAARVARNILGHNSTLRVDANMAWDRNEAARNIRALERYGIHWVEQPLDAHDLAGMAQLVRNTDADIIADESFCDRESLERLIEQCACTGVNVRISKCGGLIAAARRCRQALDAGLTVHIGCQVGESSLLSAAQLILISAVREARCFEGCYGGHLLLADPACPRLQLGFGGRPPRIPQGAGLAVEVDEAALSRFVDKRVVVAGLGVSRKEHLYVTSR